MGVIEVVKKQERKEGRMEGRSEERKKAKAERLNYARTLKEMGYPVEDIVKALGLTVKQVENL